MKKITDLYDLIVVGAGAAGLMAAGAAVKNGRRVLVFDKNDKLARKVRITGKGRCNVTNDCTPAQVIAASVGNGRFLYGAVNAFSPADTMAFFESLGVPLKTERGNRVFPVSDNAHDIAEALVRWAKGAAVVKQRAERILTENGAVTGVAAGGKEYTAPKVLIATGGASYQATGSTGDGYRMAEELGHTVVPPRPSLVGLVSDDPDCAAMQGLSMKNCGLKLFEKSGKKAVYEDFGELLFTHFGISGPTVLSASAHIRGNPSDCFILLDVKPALSPEQLDLRLLRDLNKNSNKNFANSLSELLPQKMIGVVVKRSGIPAEKKCNSVTKEERVRLLDTLKNFKIELLGFRPINEAVITAGGVSVKEVNPKTMESKLVKGLYFAGEVLDVDAYTGGYNLQIAFSTGYLAGVNA